MAENFFMVSKRAFTHTRGARPPGGHVTACAQAVLATGLRQIGHEIFADATIAVVVALLSTTEITCGYSYCLVYPSSHKR